MRCISTFILVSYFEMGLLSFGISQIIYSWVLVLGYFGYFLSTKSNVNSFRDLFPRFSRPYFNPATMDLVLTFSWQAVQKLVLQEGEKFVLYFTSSLPNQGIYSIVNNLGSLVARFLFQPLEEISFSAFSEIANRPGPSLDEKRREISYLIKTLFKVMFSIGLYFIAFGPSYSFFLLNNLYGPKYADTEAPFVLSCYCFYVCFMAINGITEAFVQSLADQSQLAFFNLLMTFFSVTFVSFAVVLIHQLDTAGLILANCLNMAMRIFFSVRFIKNYLQIPISNLLNLPSKAMLLHFFLVFLSTSLSNSLLCQGRLEHGCYFHFAVGVFFFFTTTAHYYLAEWSSILPLWRAVMG